MPPTLPFWFKQRQCKAEPAGSDYTVKVSGPNVPEAFLSIAPGDDGRWNASLRFTADGPAVSTAEGLASVRDAWEAAFELFRVQVIV
jgi:hypothetical protein